MKIFERFVVSGAICDKTFSLSWQSGKKRPKSIVLSRSNCNSPWQVVSGKRRFTNERLLLFEEWRLQESISLSPIYKNRFVKKTVKESPYRSSKRFGFENGAFSEESEKRLDDVVKSFTNRWRRADELHAADKVCTRVWEEHKPVGILGEGRYARTFVVVHLGTGKKIALKLCSFLRFGQGRRVARGMAGLGYTTPPDDFDEDSVALHVKEVRVERLLLQCLSGLSPFVMSIAGDCGYSCIYDEAEGELGYPMRVGVASVRLVWRAFDKHIEKKDKDLVKGAAKELLVFWAAQMSEAVRFLHKCQIIHGDVRAENFIVDRDLYIRLSDFGRSFVSGCIGRDAPIQHPPSVRAFMRQKRHSKWRHTQKENFCCEQVQSIRRLLENKTEEEQEKVFEREVSKLNKLRDLFELGKALFSLNWPQNKHFAIDLNGISSVADFQNYQGDHPEWTAGVLAGDLLDFVNLLTADRDKHETGFEHSDDLIGHSVFRDLNFEDLRAKRIAPPIHMLMLDALIKCNCNIKKIKAGSQRIEKSYCDRLSLEEKSIFRSNYLPE